MLAGSLEGDYKFSSPYVLRNCLCACMHVCAYARVYLHVHLNVLICVHICIHICVPVCICMCRCVIPPHPRGCRTEVIHAKHRAHGCQLSSVTVDAERPGFDTQLCQLLTV